MWISLVSRRHSDNAALNQIGPEWTTLHRLGIAFAAEATPVPQAVASLPRRLVSDDTLAIVQGIDAILTQARRHSRLILTNGNPKLAAGNPPIPYPEVNSRGDAIVAGSQRLPTAAGWIAVLNLSLGSAAGRPFDPADLLNVATRRAARVMPVVVAAGNATPLHRGPAALNSWARAPWVTSVASLRDGKLAPDSALGSPGQRTSWPDFAAPDDQLTEFDITTGVVSAFRGTSAAAPVVAHQVVALAAFCLTLDALLRDGPVAVHGIPRVGWAVVDAGIDPELLPASPWQYGALPQIGIEVKAARQLAAVIDRSGPPTRAIPTPTLLRRLLRASARPVAGHGRFEVGHGEISYGTTAVFLARLTALSMFHLLFPDRTLPGGAEKQLDVPLLTDALDDAIAIWHSNTVVWAWDYRRRPELLWSLSFVDETGKEPL